jgi:hypothetical protein
MARLLGSARSTGISLGAATVETCIQLVAATNHRVALVGYGIGGRGTSNTDTPGVIDILRQTTAGTASALTVYKLDDSIADSLVTTAQETFTAEPTAGDILRTHTVHPQAALDVRDAYSREIIIGGSDRLGLRATYAQAQTVDAYMDFEE